MRIPGWLFILGVLVLVGMTAVCSVFSFVGTRRMVVDLAGGGLVVDSPITLIRHFTANRNAIGGGTPTPANLSTRLAMQPTTTNTPPPANVIPTRTPQPGVAQLEAVAPTATLDPMAGVPDWPDPRQFTVLLLGIDQRTGVADEERYFRTDTMMIVSVDPVRMRAGVLSIPRDLWVTIPGSTEARINTANSWGDSISYPGGGGPALAAETVEYNLGIEIDKYVLINFDVFTSVVNLLAPDGVEICVSQEIDDPYYPDAGYGFIHVHFDPGCQMLDAEHLLQYARTRHTEGSDFDRARRQQEVLRALREEVLSAGGIANFVTQIPALWDELSGSFRTNMSLEEMLSLAQLAQEIDQDNIHFGVIDNMATTFATTSSGDQVLIPNYAAIRELILETFYPPDNGAAATSSEDASGDSEELSLAELRQRAEGENARIVVFNNTITPGLAQRTREWLISEGVSVEDIDSMPDPTLADTTIRVYNDKPWTARYLAALLGIPESQIAQVTPDGLTTADIMIAAGNDIESLLTSDS